MVPKAVSKFPSGNKTVEVAWLLATMLAGPAGSDWSLFGCHSLDRETRRWMDYLGYERECDNSLLMVESKRPSVRLPATPNHTGNANRHPLGAIIRDYVAAKGRPGSPHLRSAQAALGKIWVEYIDTHIDYLNGIRESGSHFPKRTVITNGDWIVIFGTTTDLLSSKESGAAEILVYPEFEIVKQEAEEIFRYLAYQNLCRFPFPIRDIEIPAFIDLGAIQKAAYRTHLTYSVAPGLYKSKPYVRAAPLVFLQAENGSVTGVMSSTDNDIDAGQYLDYERSCQNALSLYDATCHILGWSVPLMSCQGFLSTCSIPPVWQTEHSAGVSKYMLITGEHPYFVVPNDCHSGCVGHERAQAGINWVLNSNPPSTDPQKTMFVNGDPALCGHKDVEAIRLASIPIGPVANSERIGRSRRRCHLSEFEEYACCRSCCYIEICSKDNSFSLPRGDNGLTEIHHVENVSGPAD